MNKLLRPGAVRFIPIWGLCCGLLLSLDVWANDVGIVTFHSLQKTLNPSEVVVYKTVGDIELGLHCFYPEGWKVGARLPAFVAVHGGGWTSGEPRRFYPYAQSMATKGWVAFSVKYRLMSKKEGITVWDCVKDVRAAIRFIRKHAHRFGIDPDRVGVAGGSAGGHLASGTALFQGVDHVDDDLSISCQPNALVLYFPVIDTSLGGYGNAKLGARWEALSPVHQVRPGIPPTLVFHGVKDTVTPYAGAVAFQEKMATHENICELVTDEKGKHAHLHRDYSLFSDAMERTSAFLRVHGLGQ